MKWRIPENHPRYESLKRRERLVECFFRGITDIHGLIAHGRGEAFDYLIGEHTTESAMKATEVAAEIMLTARKPVISVNGNVAALAPHEIVSLSNVTGARIEVNLFHRTEDRVMRIKKLLEKYGARDVLGENADIHIPGLKHTRGMVERDGIYDADVVLVSLEDGDRCEALVNMGKIVIAIDLNPLSRTAQSATVTIVDDVERALRNMIEFVRKKQNEMKKNKNKMEETNKKNNFQKILNGYDNRKILNEVLEHIVRRLLSLAESDTDIQI